jgi:glycine cleavage system H protein
MIDEKTLKFAETHEWVHLDGDVATVGISRFAVDQLTDLILVELPEVGRKLGPGKPFGVVESVKSVSDLYAPVAGEVVAVNEDVVKNVQILSEDPYDRGWLVKIKLDAPGSLDASALLDYNAYQKKVADEAH